MPNLRNYINYLNTLHNANAGNSGAIAESQVKNDYYKHIEVERNIASKIFRKLEDENILLILTGHAGDGKTALLSQVLEKTGNFSKGNILEKKGYLKIGNKNLFYLKDFSEFNRVEQYINLEEAIANSSFGSSILVTNVGPLMDNLKTYFMNLGISVEDAEDEILNAIDSNKGDYLIINGIKRNIIIFNIAKINNTSFIPEFIDKILDEKLWKDEEYSHSILYKNFEILSQNKERVKVIVEKFYQWLYEHDQRSTIRQIIAHLAYSLTGNLELDFSYSLDFSTNNFGHFFFGYKNESVDNSALQIDSIRKIQKLNLDERPFHIDYKYFVEGKFEHMNNQILDYYKNRIFIDMELSIFKEVRKSFRRMYIFFSEDETQLVLKDLFGETYLEYLNMKQKGETNLEFDETIFRALYKIFSGQPLENSSKTKIYITLRREGSFIQNIQLIQGEIKRKNIKIGFKQNENEFAEKEFEILLKVKSQRENETEIKLTYPIIEYFIELEKGAVKTDIDPHLSNGIDSIKAKLGALFAYDEDELDTISLLVRTNEGNEVYNLEIERDKIKMYQD